MLSICTPMKALDECCKVRGIPMHQSGLLICATNQSSGLLVSSQSWLCTKLTYSLSHTECRAMAHHQPTCAEWTSRCSGPGLHTSIVRKAQ